MPVKCDYCGAESEFEQSYTKVRRSFSRKFRWVCPNCLQAKKKTKFKRLAWYWLATIVIGIAFLFVHGARKFGFYILNLTLFDLCLLLTILPHELGHAGIAKLVGFRVFRVIVGSGRSFYKRRISGFLLELKTVPFGGFTLAAPILRERIRWKFALYIIGGPAVNLALASTVYLLAPRPFWPQPSHSFPNDPLLCLFDVLGTQLMLPQMILISNAYVLVANLWPRQIKTAFGIIPSDGLALWRTFFMKEERIEALLAAYYIHEANECFEEGRHKEIGVWAEEGLKKYPDNEILMNYLGISLLEQMRLDDARRLFLGQIHPPAKNEIVYAMALNNLAYGDVLTEDPSLLEEAERCSSLAIAKLAWHPSVKGTRGAVLVETGKFEEGIRLLQEAVATHEDNKSKAINACFLSAAQRKLGCIELAEKYLKMAETLDPKCVLLERTRRAT